MNPLWKTSATCLIALFEAPPIWVIFVSVATYYWENLILFVSSVYLCPSLATLLNYCMCERGNWLINRLKKLKIFQNLFNNIFKNSLICCKKCLWSFESLVFFVENWLLIEKKLIPTNNFFLGYIVGWCHCMTTVFSEEVYLRILKSML